MGWGLWVEQVPFLMAMGNWSLGGRLVASGDAEIEHELVRALEKLKGYL